MCKKQTERAAKYEKNAEPEALCMCSTPLIQIPTIMKVDRLSMSSVLAKTLRMHKTVLIGFTNKVMIKST
jgi:hypothetical protein